MKAVLDSNFIVALLDTNDVWHKQAEEIDIAMHESITRIFLDVALIESVTVFARRSSERKQISSFPLLASLLTAVVPNEKIVWLCPDIPNKYESTIELMQEHSGKLSFFDCLIASFLRTIDNSYLLSFDRDFDLFPWIRRVSSAREISNL